jgi:putative inorganic carbon (hco3(-)) transporter
LTLQSAKWLYLLLIASLPLVRPFSLTLFGLLVPLTDFIFIGAALTWVIALLKRQTDLKFSWFYLPLGLYLAAMLCSTLASDDPRRSAIKLAGEVYLIGLAVLTVNLVRSQVFLRRVMCTWTAVTAVTVLLGVLGVLLFYAGVRDGKINLVLSGYGSLPPANYPRIRGLFDNMNMLCNYLNVSLMIVLVMSASGWLRSTLSRPLQAGIWFAAVFTVSPGLGGLFLSQGLWAWARLGKTQRRSWATLALVVGLAAAVAFIAAATISPVVTGTGPGYVLPCVGMRVEPSSRVLAWQTAFETFRENPLLGKGVGMEVSYTDYLDASGRQQHLTDAHNLWLSIAGQEGVFGLVAFFSIVFFLCRRLVNLRVDSEPKKAIRTGLGIAFIGAAIYQGLSGSFEDARHLWVLMGVIVSASEGLGEPEHQ